MNSSYTLADLQSIVRTFQDRGKLCKAVGPSQTFWETATHANDVCQGSMTVSVKWPKQEPLVLPFKYFCNGATNERRSTTITPGEQSSNQSGQTLNVFRLW